MEFSAEDASRSDYGYLREVLQAVHEAGAAVLNMPDTVGYALPDEYAALIARLRARRPDGVVLSVHCHDDLGLAVANSLAAVRGRRAAGRGARSTASASAPATPRSRSW